MAQNDMLKRYLDAGVAFTAMTRARAEAIVKDLVKAGEVQRDQATDRIDDLLERSRKNTEALLEMVRAEVSDQLGSLGLATKADLDRLEAMITNGTASTPAAAASPTETAPGNAAAKAPVKRAAGKAGKAGLVVPDAPVGAQTAAKRAAKTAAPAKKAPAKKAPAKKS